MKLCVEFPLSLHRIMFRYRETRGPFTMYIAMARTGVFTWLLLIKCALGYIRYNSSLPPTDTQLLDFKLEHPKPIGFLTVGSGARVDVRDLVSINSDLLRDDYFFDSQIHIAGERVPERTVLSKGTAAWGYFEVTHDVSKYTSADAFNSIGKKTPVLGRFAAGFAEKGGSDLGRDLKSLSTKFYTREGNLDLLCMHMPFIVFKDPIDFSHLVHSTRRNARTNIRSNPLTALVDIFPLKPHTILTLLYFLSDYGLPDGWRHMDAFPIHAYELTNKYGERWYVRFNYRTEQGLKNLTTQQGQQIQSTDLDYFIRDLYNAIENKNYPSWRLEMDVLSLDDVQNVDFNPFDITVFWKPGSYHTVPIGRLTFTRNTENQFRDQEQAAFSPANLVPGIPGPVDIVMKGRRVAYRDAQNYRIRRNHMKLSVNAPLYAKTYVRDGHPPVGDNGRDAPNYYPNSYNGPAPFVDDRRSREQLEVLHSYAVDLQYMADFYNEWLDDSGRQRLVANLVQALQTVTDPARGRIIKILTLIDSDLGRRLTAGVKLVAFRKKNG